QRRNRVRLVQVLDDGKRLHEARAVRLQCRHQRLWIDRGIFRPAVLAAAEVHERRLVGKPLQIERDAHAKRRGTAERGVKLHRTSFLRPSRRAAFSFRMRGRTSGLIGSFSNSASHRSGRITGLSLPNSTLSLSSEFAYWTSLGSKYLGDQ